MKEYLSDIDPVDYDQVVYPQLVTGHLVGQKNILTDDILLTVNPEKPQADFSSPEVKEKPVRHPLQGELLRTEKPLYLAAHPRSGGTVRGRRP